MTEKNKRRKNKKKILIKMLMKLRKKQKVEDLAKNYQKTLKILAKLV